MSNQDKDVACVSVRRMCEALGLDPKTQIEKLAAPKRTPWVTVLEQHSFEVGDERTRKESKQ